MKKYSKSIKVWGDIVLVIAVITILVGLIAWTLGYGVYAMAVGFGILILSPLIDGFAVLVQNAEEQIERRTMVTFEKND